FGSRGSTNQRTDRHVSAVCEPPG
ncbi:unnamed protein product, partial [Allacma fusca]